MGGIVNGTNLPHTPPTTINLSLVFLTYYQKLLSSVDIFPYAQFLWHVERMEMQQKLYMNHLIFTIDKKLHNDILMINMK